MMRPVEKALTATVDTVGKAACWLFLPLMLLIVFDVVGRRFLSLPTVMLQELEWYLHGILLLLTLGYGYISNAHVRIDVLSEKLPFRVRSLIELLGILVFVIPYFALLLYLSVGFAVSAYEGAETSSAAQGLTQRWIIKAFLPIGFALVILSGLAVGLAQLRNLYRGSEEDPSSPDDGSPPRTAESSNDGAAS